VSACFDSNVVIDVLKGLDPAREALREVDVRIVSIVTWIEVLAGCRDDDEEARARQLLAAMTVVPMGDLVAEEAMRLRRQMRIKLPDAVILSTARVAGCQLVTRNTRDFREDDPNVRVPYRL